MAAPDLFDTLVDRLIGREGGYVNDPRDAGGETIWGVTRASPARTATPGPWPP
jgi:lysozyme family protein